MHESYALIGAQLFDPVDGSLIKGRAVHVEAGQIAALCQPEALPPSIERLDLTGKTILPGLIDVHVHSEDWQAPLYLAKGITTVRDVGCELRAVLERRARWNMPDSAAPRLICTGPLLDGPGNTWPAMSQIVDSPEEARAHVDRLVESGVDQIKLYAFLDWPCFEAIIDRAHQHGKFTIAHLGKYCDARKAVEAGLDEIEHLSGVGEALCASANETSPTWDWMAYWAAYDADRARRFADYLVEKGVWLAITRLVWLRLATLWDTRHWSHPQVACLPGPLRAFWEARFPRVVPTALRQERSQQAAGMSLFTTELIRRGAKILVGTDAPFPHLLPGFSYHDELQALLDCGMGEISLLRSCTLLAAQALGIDHLTGSLAPGKCADLIVAPDDPTRDIHALDSIELVIRAGQRLDPAQLLAQAAAYASAAQPSPSRRFSEHY